mmetsp:Transcript_384/g.1006  ORF Transcript_384/g.1006 Transcript_384/m.1006 type:complete len:494 (+) Transcript_384:298-1779(+)
MSKLVLRDGRGPDLDPQHLRIGRVRPQEDLSEVSVDRGYDVVVVHRSYGGIAAAPDVVEEYVVVRGTASGEEARAPQGAEGAHSLRPGIERAEPREVPEVAEVVVELDVLEGCLRIGDGDGRDGGVVYPLSVDDVPLPREEVGRPRQDRLERAPHGVRGHGRHDGLGRDALFAVGRVVRGPVDRPVLLHLRELPFQLDPLAELLLDCRGERAQSPLEGAGISVLELDPAGVRRIGLPLLRQLDLPGQSAVEEGAELIPLDGVGVLLDPRYLRQRGLHAERGRIAGVHAAHERVDDPVEHLVAEDAPDPVLDGLLLALRGGHVADEGADAGAYLPRPREEVADESELEHAVRAEDQLDLPLGPLPALSLGERVELPPVVDPRRQTLVGEDQLVVYAELVRYPDDARLRREGVGTLLVHELAVFVADHLASNVPAKVVPRLGQEHIHVRVVEVVRQCRAGDAAADDDAVAVRLGLVRRGGGPAEQVGRGQIAAGG